jgi:hypothetical protein
VAAAGRVVGSVRRGRKGYARLGMKGGGLAGIVWLGQDGLGRDGLAGTALLDVVRQTPATQAGLAAHGVVRRCSAGMATLGDARVGRAG